MWSDLLTYINTKIYPNANNEITALKHREALNRFVSDAYVSGFATIATTDGTPTLNGDTPKFWIAKKGTYPNYGGLTVTKDLGIISYRGAYTLHEIDLAIYPQVNNTPLSSEPAVSGNLTNLNSFVIWNGNKYFIDNLGNSTKLFTAVSNEFNLFQVTSITGTTITLSDTTIADQLTYSDVEMDMNFIQIKRGSTWLNYNRTSPNQVEFYAVQSGLNVVITLGRAAVASDIFRIKIKS